MNEVTISGPMQGNNTMISAAQVQEALIELAISKGWTWSGDVTD